MLDMLEIFGEPCEPGERRGDRVGVFEWSLGGFNKTSGNFLGDAEYWLLVARFFRIICFVSLRVWSSWRLNSRCPRMMLCLVGFDENDGVEIGMNFAFSDETNSLLIWGPFWYRRNWLLKYKTSWWVLPQCSSLDELTGTRAGLTNAGIKLKITLSDTNSASRVVSSHWQSRVASISL